MLIVNINIKLVRSYRTTVQNYNNHIPPAISKISRNRSLMYLFRNLLLLQISMLYPKTFKNGFKYKRNLTGLVRTSPARVSN